MRAKFQVWVPKESCVSSTTPYGWLPQAWDIPSPIYLYYYSKLFWQKSKIKVDIHHVASFPKIWLVEICTLCSQKILIGLNSFKKHLFHIWRQINYVALSTTKTILDKAAKLQNIISRVPLEQTQQTIAFSWSAFQALTIGRNHFKLFRTVKILDINIFLLAQCVGHAASHYLLLLYGSNLPSR